MAKFNNFQVRNMQTMPAGITQMRSLAEFGILAGPEFLDKTITRMFTANYGYSFNTIINKMAKTENYAHKVPITWNLMGSTYRNIPLVECRDEDGLVVDSSNTKTAVGKYGAMFQLVFQEQLFADGELLLGRHNEYYPIRIIGDPISEGSNVVYNVQLMGNAYESGIPVEDVQSGELFNKTYAPVEDERSRKVSDVSASIPSQMMTGWSTIRQDKTFTGAADEQQRLCCTIPVQYVNSDNQVVKTTADTWFTVEEWTFYQQWQRVQNDLLLWARDNRNNAGQYVDFGKSGNIIELHDGIMAQMEAGNTTYYNTFDLKTFVREIMDIYTNGNVPMSERKIVVVTGEQGMMLVNEAIKQDTAGFGIPLEVDANGLGIIKRTDNEVNQNSLQYGAQFTKLIGPNGLEMNFVCEMSLDDPIRNKIPGFDGHGRLSSYAFYVFDLGSSSTPNIVNCKLTGSQYADDIRYKIGLRNPWGIDRKLISSDEDASSMHTIISKGAYIVDPTRCMRYMPVGLVA